MGCAPSRLQSLRLRLSDATLLGIHDTMGQLPTALRSLRGLTALEVELEPPISTTVSIHPPGHRVCVPTTMHSWTHRSG